jgi:hypothetical protein
MIDGTILENLSQFWIYLTDDSDEKIIEKLWHFPAFCQEQGINKRTFNERIGIK